MRKERQFQTLNRIVKFMSFIFSVHIRLKFLFYFIITIYTHIHRCTYAHISSSFLRDDIQKKNIITKKENHSIKFDYL